MNTTTQKQAVKPTSTNYAAGAELLKKAVAAQKDTCRFYGMYVQWIAKHSVPFEVIVKQFVELKGWSVKTAKKYATAVILLGEANNTKHLEALINADIDFEVALMRMIPIQRPPIVYNDEETAVRCLHRAFIIMLHQNRGWQRDEIMVWVKNVTDKFMIK